MKHYAKFAALVVVILGTLGWLAKGGIENTKTYYKTIQEVGQMGPQAMSKNLRLAGDVVPGSIVRTGQNVRFRLSQDKLQMEVLYTGNDPLPDTFRANAQALADGRMRADGTFEARKIQAKCASKYEAKPGQMKAAVKSETGI